MSLPDILLSLLREPMSGTDLIRHFHGTFEHFWKTDLSQIYRALETLEREGSLVSEKLPSPRGPSKRVYRLTAKGRRRLVAWIKSSPRVPPAKLEFLAQLFSVTADERPRDRARDLLRSLRDDAARGVAVLQAIDSQLRAVPGYPEALPAFLFYPWLTLRHGLLRRRALLAWIDESLDLLDRRPGLPAADANPEAMSELVAALSELATQNALQRPSTEKE